MERALIHYFSGTGNSLFAARQLGQELMKYGYEAEYHSMENGQHDTSSSYSLHIFFFPVYATAVPHIVRKYIRSLPDGSNARTAVISTNGRISTRIRDGYQGWALHQARLYLGLKKYNVFYSNTLDFPHNVTIVLPPRNSLYNERIISRASDEIPQIAEQIVKGNVFHRRIFILNFIWSIPFGVMYSIVGRRAFGKLFAADSSCTSCGLCVEKCPAKAIVKEANCIRWKWNCEGCLRCINSCPKNAIQTSVVHVIAIILAMNINIFNYVVSDSFTKVLGSIGASILNFCTGVISFVLVIDLLYWIFQKASTIPFMKKFIGLGFTKLYGRYNAKDFDERFQVKKIEH